jgi:ribosomal protein S9
MVLWFVVKPDAITLAIARALCKIDRISWLFKIKGLLTRDAELKNVKNMV